MFSRLKRWNNFLIHQILTQLQYGHLLLKFHQNLVDDELILLFQSKKRYVETTNQNI